jgi:hypothetical protein
MTSPNRRILRPPVDDAHAAEAEAVIAEWHHRLKANGPLCPAPTIQQAQRAYYGWLIVECADCGRIAHVPFESIRRPPATPIADLLPALICTCCGQKGPPTATIRGVATHADPFVDSVTI